MGGVLGPLIAGRFVDMTNSYTLAYTFAAILSFIAVGLGIALMVIEKRAANLSQAIGQ